MRINKLTIKNFKSLIDVHMSNIPDVLVIAGPQGSGKSSVLEAIAYFKEKLGPYYGWNVPGIVNTKAQFAEIEIKFRVFQEEKDYLKAVHNIDFVGDELSGYIKIGKDGNPIPPLKSPRELSTLLSLYDRQNHPQVGIFEYLNPYRVLRRKNLTTLQLGRFTDAEEKRKRIGLQEQKFDLTKDYLAQLAMRDIQRIQELLLTGKESVRIGDVGDSLQAIKKIFNGLLAKKKFCQIDLSASPVRFIVETPQGEVDIDDLSSGEKEILSVFTDLLKLRLKNSIILFDEPDLHLNQEIERKIVEKLRSLGENNQFWIATHSFGIMGSVDFSQLYRLDHYSGSNQITRVFDDEEKYKTFKSVAGDVGIVTLGEKIAFLEGVEKTDKFILDTWFDEYKGKITFVSSGPVSNVMGISERILDLLQTSARFNFFFAIRDRDFLTDEERKELIAAGNNRLFVWSKYHIENYLLDFDVIHTVLGKNFTPNPCSDPKDVFQKMREVVIENKELFISKMVNYALNAKTGDIYFKIGFPDVESQAIDKAEKIKLKTIDVLDEKKVREIVRGKEIEFDKAIASGKWVDILPGRSLLGLILNKYTHGLAYEQFRNQIVNEIANQKKIPKEVDATISQILSTS